MSVKSIVPETKLLKVRPNWRFEILRNPAGNKFKSFLSRTENGANSLRRFIGAGLTYDVQYRIPDEVCRYTRALPEQQAKRLVVLWYRAFKKSKQKKVLVESSTSFFKHNPSWNLNKVKELTDKFLVKAIYHVCNFERDQYIEQALALHNSQDHAEAIRYIGYCIYAKVSDKDIAKRWSLPVKTVVALRSLFFDFSGFPKDRLANFTCLRQLANNGVISDVDFAFYKRVYELGELGLKAQTDFYSLTDEEKKKVEEYLGKSVVANTFNINFSIRNQKDALSYGAVVSNLASYFIKRSEITYLAAKTRNLDAATRRIEGDMIGSESLMSSLDEEIMGILREHSLHEDVQEYKTLSDLK